MAVRLRLRIKVDEKNIDVIALLNSGFEAPTPQLLISIDDAKALSLWPRQVETLLHGY
jgi:hypothetical protein